MRPATQTALADEVNEWIAQADLPIVPIRAELSTIEDALSQEGWEVLLALPRPQGVTWKTEDIFTLRRAVSRFVDERAEQLEANLPGSTLVRITAEDPDPLEVADEEPEFGDEENQ